MVPISRLMTYGEWRGARPFAGSLRVSPEYQFSPRFLAGKGAGRMSEMVFQHPVNETNAQLRSASLGMTSSINMVMEFNHLSLGCHSCPIARSTPNPSTSR